jgi:amino acid adenylation domain-containing protein
MQQGMLFHTLYDTTAGIDIIQILGDFSEPLNVSAFQTAWEQLIAHHGILRTCFDWQGLDAPVQQVMPHVSLSWQIGDWRHLPPHAQEEALHAFLQSDRQRGFDLAQAPLLRFALFQCQERRYQFVWTFHHILLDGRSFPIILQELFTVYDAARQNDLPLSPIDLLPKRRPFQDHVAWLETQAFSQAQTFWQQYLHGYDQPIQLPTLPAANTKTSFHEQEITFPDEETTRLNTFAAAHDLTLNTLVQGAWALLLSRYCGAEDVVFGATRACRRSSVTGADSMVGLLINTVPVRVRLPAGQTCLAWLQELRTQQRQLWAFEQTPLTKIQAWSQLATDQPLFETLLVFSYESLNSVLRGLGPAWQPRQFRIFRRPSFPLTLVGYGQPVLSLKLMYDPQRFPAALIAQMLDHLKIILNHFAGRPSSLIGGISILTADEYRRIVQQWNQTQTAYPGQKSIHQVFAEQAALTPEATALVFRDQQLTYQQLNEQANQLAHYLRAAGVGPEDLIVVAMDRSLEMVVAMLGILKAGAAYLPIDTSYPLARLALMLDETRSAIILTQDHLAPLLADLEQQPGQRLICLNSVWDTIASYARTNPPDRATSENLAYVMYTSGSTGRPKGVGIPHRGVVRLVKQTNFAELRADDVFLQVAPITFDAATLEIWGSLLNGACLVLFPQPTVSLSELARIIRQEGVTTLWLTAGLFHLMVDEHLEGLRPLRQLLAGGDVLSAAHVQKVRSELPHWRLINGYGPTENSTFTACYTIPYDQKADRSVPIGRPIANTTIYILDEHLRPTAVGVPGELYIGGDGLARGYFNQPALTAEKFIPNPFFSRTGAGQFSSDFVLYKTGDLVRYLPDGNIEFLGRMDNQVKIRGFRIELGEIESILQQHEAVQTAVIVTHNSLPGDEASAKQLVAYFVPVLQTPSDDELRHFLQAHLPEYMIPAIFMPLASLPLNHNGKVDRKALPVPDLDRLTATTFVAPRTAIEKRLAEGWKAILNAESVSIHDNFFALGGHSLSAIRLANWIAEAFQLQLSLAQIFTAATLSEMAMSINYLALADDVNQPDSPGKIRPVARHTRPVPRSALQPPGAKQEPL